jgi:hypothetical protein
MEAMAFFAQIEVGVIWDTFRREEEFGAAGLAFIAEKEPAVATEAIR